MITSESIILHPKLKKVLDIYSKRPPHALLISGPQGAGKDTAISYLTMLLSRIYHLELLDYTASSDFGIDELRQLWKALSRSVLNNSSMRVVVIHGLEDLSDSAQTSLLKHLEEPPGNTLFFMTTENHGLILPTIQSRSVIVPILPIGKRQAAEYLSVSVDNSDFAKNYAISQGWPGLLIALHNGQEHQLLSNINLAKKLLSFSPHDRLCHIDIVTKDKSNSPEQILNALLKISVAALKQATEHQNDFKPWLKRCDLIQRSIKDISNRANPKIVLTDIFLSI